MIKDKKISSCLSREKYLLQFQKVYLRSFLNLAVPRLYSSHLACAFERPGGFLTTRECKLCVLHPRFSSRTLWPFFLNSFRVGKVLFCTLHATYYRVLVALSRIKKKKNHRIFSQEWMASCVLAMAMLVSIPPSLETAPVFQCPLQERRRAEDAVLLWSSLLMQRSS